MFPKYQITSFQNQLFENKNKDNYEINMNMFQ
jgi:hypothetical protein